MSGATRPPRGRYAPSPTGELHLGNASSALLAWLSIRAQEGAFVMRIEDLDRNRVIPGGVERILDDLRWLGMDWDEGPDHGGPHAPYAQWERLDLYREAFDALREADRVYPCFCSRKDIAAAASAPQAPGDELRYPGTCRGIPADEARERIESGDRHAFRFRVDRLVRVEFEDRVHGKRRPAPDQPPGDFVVYRADGVPAYQLAVVVDDAAMEIDEVVRGDDLLASTERQLLLYDALEKRRPGFGHVPLLLGPDGVRLSKRHRGATLRELRERGLRPEQVVGRLAGLLGLRPGREPVSAKQLVEGFRLTERLAIPGGVVWDCEGRDESRA